MTRPHFARPRPPEQLDLAWFGITQWCALLNHACDGVRGGCRCDCHNQRKAHA